MRQVNGTNDVVAQVDIGIRCINGVTPHVIEAIQTLMNLIDNAEIVNLTTIANYSYSNSAERPPVYEVRQIYDDCIYYSGSDELKCAVNPTHPCRTCKHFCNNLTPASAK